MKLNEQEKQPSQFLSSLRHLRDVIDLRLSCRCYVIVLDFIDLRLSCRRYVILRDVIELRLFCRSYAILRDVIELRLFSRCYVISELEVTWTHRRV